MANIKNELVSAFVAACVALPVGLATLDHYTDAAHVKNMDNKLRQDIQELSSVFQCSTKSSPLSHKGVMYDCGFLNEREITSYTADLKAEHKQLTNAEQKAAPWLVAGFGFAASFLLSLSVVMRREKRAEGKGPKSKPKTPKLA
ncbi:MAG: hypothetical protein COB76_00705 [Alphaproteobacteria bacterium]|nr:MAG: hypothetical protein COB76_00705 [Alphaproteobacteria bacterium]